MKKPASRGELASLGDIRHHSLRRVPVHTYDPHGGPGAPDPPRTQLSRVALKSHEISSDTKPGTASPPRARYRPLAKLGVSRHTHPDECLHHVVSFASL